MFSFIAEVISEKAMLGWAKLKNQEGEDVSFHKNPLLLFKHLWDGWCQEGSILIPTNR